MTNPRIEAFRTLLNRTPDNSRARFGLAIELEKEGMHDEAGLHFRQYLAAHDDEGNGWGRYAESLANAGHRAEAKEALVRGIDAARRFAHSGLVAELEEKLEELDTDS